MPNRRTMAVLGTLLAAMTLTSGLLLLLEPGPVPVASLVPLSHVQAAPRAQDALFQTQTPLDAHRWRAIVIHFSGSESGALTPGQPAPAAGLGGYHFVIGNGQGASDGQVQTSPHWADQKAGAHSGGPDGAWFNEFAVGVCVVGQPEHTPPTRAQLESLVWTVQQLQRRLSIPADRVLLDPRIYQDPQQADLFPVGWFRQQLLSDVSL